MKVSRITIYAKDISLITGRTERYSRKLMKKIRDRLQKDRDQFISIEEFCAYTGLSYDEVMERLN